MIKRDSITEVRLTRKKDGQGGSPFDIEIGRSINATVSVGASPADMTQFNLKTEQVIHTVTNHKLDSDQNTRYKYDDVLYQVRWQAKRGVEYFAILVETPN